MIKLSRPLNLFFSLLTYFLGVSVAVYLGESIQKISLGFVAIGVLLIQLSMFLLPEVFRIDREPLQSSESPSARAKLRSDILSIVLGALGVTSILLYILFANDLLPQSSIYLINLAILILLVYSVPPFRFSNRGYGEILLAIQFGYVYPSLAFTLQTGEFHPYLNICIPLMFIAFGFFITSDFQTFADDQKYGRVTLLTRLGWERVVPLHHIFIIFAYIFFIVMTVFGLPISFLWPVFLTLPFALYQIFQLRNISLGLPPNWRILDINAIAVFGLTIYFLILTFWIR